MNISIARTLAGANRHPEQIIRRGEEDTTHLVYLDEWQRFAAMRIYRREFFADASVVRQFLDRVAEVQARFASGIAYPLLGGHENGRLYLLLQQLPGHTLADLVRHRGPLEPNGIITLAGLIAERFDFVHRHYGLAPALLPDEICIHRDGVADWTIGFSGYDLRPVRQPWGVSPETRAIQDLTLILHFLHSGSLPPSFPELLQQAPATPETNPAPLARLFQILLSPQEEERPQTLADFLRTLDEAAPEPAPQPNLTQPPVSRSLLPWVPETTALTDRFHYRHPIASLEFPASFEAQDLLEERPCRLHVLPPIEPDRPRLRTLVQQCVRLAARQPAAPEFAPIDSVLSDPSCCLLCEPPPSGLSLWDIIKRRERIPLSETITLLRLLSAAIEKIRQRRLVLPVLEPQNLLLRSTLEPARELWWEDLSDPSTLSLTIRPFPTNPLFSESPRFTEFTGRGAARARRTRNYFHPDFSEAAIAHRILRCAFLPEEDTPAPLAAVFQKAFARTPASLPLLLPRLEKAARTVMRLQPAGPQANHSPSPAASTQTPSPSRLRLPLFAYPKSKAAQSALLAAFLLLPFAPQDHFSSWPASAAPVQQGT